MCSLAEGVGRELQVARTKSGVRRGGATIADVAARAGVSLSTVSRVMNGSTTVDAALAEA